MNVRIPRPLIAVVLLAIAAASAAAQVKSPDDKPTESPHIAGPDGLEGWTLQGTLPPEDNYGDEKFDFTLVIARHGHVIRRIQGGAFIWRWMFWANGRQVIYESGPLHFSADCVLEDVLTGKQLAEYDCYHEEPQPEPDWVQALERSEHP